ncbi:12255_t:CDS:2, partial [Entrophospora sp. SA101]
MFCLSVLSAYLSQLTSVTLTHKLTTVFGIDIFKKSSGELSKDEERGSIAAHTSIHFWSASLMELAVYEKKYTITIMLLEIL